MRSRRVHSVLDVKCAGIHFFSFFLMYGLADTKDKYLIAILAFFTQPIVLAKSLVDISVIFLFVLFLYIFFFKLASVFSPMYLVVLSMKMYFFIVKFCQLLFFFID